MPEFLGPDEEGNELSERQDVEQVSPSALAVLNRSEHAAMVATANLPGNRRKLAEFDSKLMAYANHSQPVALSMFYSLPRAGKQLIGASVRFAEIVAPCWRNCAVAARVIGDSANTVTAQGIFLDYEANLRNSIEVPRRITDKNSNRFTDDMIITTSNAAMSVARRNAVLKGGVPQALWTPAYEAAQLTAVGKAASHAQRVADAMEYLNKIGVTEWQILNAVGVPSVRELETEHLVTLRVLCTEIKRGDKTIEQVFGSAYDKELDSLFAQLKMNQAQQTMLKNSYLGRAAELVAYLKERLGSAGTGQSVDDWIAQKSGPAYNAKEAAKQQAKSDDKPESPTIPDDSTPSTKTVTVETKDGGTSNVVVETGQNLTDDTPRIDPTTVTGKELPPFDLTQPEAPKRRGRPTAAEIARRKAQEQGALIPQSEQEARQEAENMTDNFSF